MGRSSNDAMPIFLAPTLLSLELLPVTLMMLKLLVSHVMLTGL